MLRIQRLELPRVTENDLTGWDPDLSGQLLTAPLRGVGFITI